MSTVQAISVVCFDAFGTLIRYGGQRTNPYRHLLNGGPDKQTERRPFLTRNVGIDVFADELGLSHLLPVIRQELDTEIAGLQLFPEVELALRAVRAAGKRVAVCSNLAQEYGQVVRQLLPDLDGYILSYEAGVSKPDPEIYGAVCGLLGSRPRDVLFIGDSKRCDLHGPQAFGMQARWLDRRSDQTLMDALERAF